MWSEAYIGTTNEQGYKLIAKPSLTGFWQQKYLNMDKQAWDQKDNKGGINHVLNKWGEGMSINKHDKKDKTAGVQMTDKQTVDKNVGIG